MKANTDATTLAALLGDDSASRHITNAIARIWARIKGHAMTTDNGDAGNWSQFGGGAACGAEERAGIAKGSGLMGVAGAAVAGLGALAGRKSAEQAQPPQQTTGPVRQTIRARP